MRPVFMIFALAACATAAAIGCKAPAPARVPVPAGRDESFGRDPVKPMPGDIDDSSADAQNLNDPPLVTQHPPEEPAFVEAYNHVGRPRIAVFVNRTPDGALIPAGAPEAPGGSIFSATPADQNSVRINEAYVTMENHLTDLFAANGQVTVLSPVMVRQKLSEDQIKEIQAGNAQQLGKVAQEIEADILVQAQVIPIEQTPKGLRARVLAEAINTRGGQSIARAFVDIDPPIDRGRIEQSSRFLARKLMDGMTTTWTTMADNPPVPPPTQQPFGASPSLPGQTPPVQVPPATAFPVAPPSTMPTTSP